MVRLLWTLAGAAAIGAAVYLIATGGLSSSGGASVLDRPPAPVAPPDPFAPVAPETGSAAAAPEDVPAPEIRFDHQHDPPGPPTHDLPGIEKLVEKGERSAALDALDRLIAAEPENGDALVLRGKLHLELGWYRRAEKDFSRAARKKDFSPSELLSRAEALLRLRQTARAEDLVRRSLSLAPDRARSHAVMAVIHLREGRTAAADGEIREAVRLDPEEPLTKTLAGRLER